MDPFIIYGLPRSRTLWLSKFLATDGWTVHHDLPLSVNSLSEIRFLLSQERAGTVETALSRAAPMFRCWFPEAPLVVVLRPVNEVKSSMDRIGWSTSLEYLEAEESNLNEISKLPNAITVRFEDLATQTTCQQVLEHCLRQPFDYDRWKEFSVTNLQVDPVKHLELVMSRAELIDDLYHEINNFVTIQVEHMDTAFRDSSLLRKAHFVEAGPFAGLPFDPDIEQFERMDQAGSLVIVTARCPGDGMVGYLVFILSRALECRTKVMAQQNIFFVMEKYRGKLGRNMLIYGLRYLKSLGVDLVMFRSGVRASGPRLKHIFKRMGAHSLGELYLLPLEQ